MPRTPFRFHCSELSRGTGAALGWWRWSSPKESEHPQLMQTQSAQGVSTTEQNTHGGQQHIVYTHSSTSVSNGAPLARQRGQIDSMELSGLQQAMEGTGGALWSTLSVFILEFHHPLNPLIGCGQRESVLGWVTGGQKKFLFTKVKLKSSIF